MCFPPLRPPPRRAGPLPPTSPPAAADSDIDPLALVAMDRYDGVTSTDSDGAARSKQQQQQQQQHPNATGAEQPPHAEQISQPNNDAGQLSPVPSASTRSGSLSDTPGSQASLSSASSSLSSASMGSNLSAMAGGGGGASNTNGLSPAQSSSGGSTLGVLTPNGTAVSAGSDDGTILFVGDLSRGVKEEELEALFSRYGTLQAVDIKRDKLTHNNLGYGFVQLSSRAEATRAKAALQGREVFGRKIRIGWAQKNTTLFVGDLDGSINTTQLVRAFEPFGHIIVEETFVKQPSGKYGFVRFGSREDAERAKSEMNHKMLGSRPIRIGWGDSNFEKHCVHIQFESSALSLTTGASVNAVFHESFFQETFTPFAVAAHTSIQNISLPKHSHTKKLKGFAFIHFEESEAGEAAAMLALQTLTNQFNQTPLPQHLQQAQQIQQSNAHGLAIGHLQSYGGQQAEGHSANSVQTHLLGGIPVKYSFGKRQIFSRHRRANENAAAMAAAGMGGVPNGLSGLGNPALGLHGVGGQLGVGASHGHGQVGGAAHLTPLQLQSMAAMMHGMINGGAGGNNGANLGTAGLNGPNLGQQRGGGGRNHSGGGGSYNGGGGRNSNPNAVLNPYGQPAALAAVAAQSQPGLYNTAAYLPYIPASPVQQQQSMSRYHTNPQQQSYLANHSVMQSPQQSQQQQHQSSHAHVHSPSQSVSADSAATTWMLQNLAASQGYSQGMAAPLSVQQVQQAYQAMQQQQQQQQHQQHPVSGLGANAYYSSDIAAAAAAAVAVSPPAPALESSTEANLASAANAFFNAQSQYYAAAQQQQQHQQQHQHQSPQSHSQSNAATPLSMHQLINDINGLALNQQQQAQQQHAVPLISSGHSSAATSPSHAANTHALQNYYSQSQIKPLLH